MQWPIADQQFRIPGWKIAEEVVPVDHGARRNDIGMGHIVERDIPAARIPAIKPGSLRIIVLIPFFGVVETAHVRFMRLQEPDLFLKLVGIVPIIIAFTHGGIPGPGAKAGFIHVGGILLHVVNGIEYQLDQVRVSFLILKTYFPCSIRRTIITYEYFKREFCFLMNDTFNGLSDKPFVVESNHPNGT